MNIISYFYAFKLINGNQQNLFNIYGLSRTLMGIKNSLDWFDENELLFVAGFDDIAAIELVV